MSHETTAPRPATVAPNVDRSAFPLDRPWRLHPMVAVRPEPFGALLYHFGTRRLSFLKSPTVVAVVESLAGHPSAGAACSAAGVAETDLPAYRTALATLAASQMIIRREDDV